MYHVTQINLSFLDLLSGSNIGFIKFRKQNSILKIKIFQGYRFSGNLDERNFKKIQFSLGLTLFQRVNVE